MARAELKSKDNALKISLTKMISRAKDPTAYLNRNLFRQYQKAQVGRWQSENSSETGKWDELNSVYKARKLKLFTSYPGGGSKMLIAKSKLFFSATGSDTSGFFKIATPTQLQVGINRDYVPYAGYVAEKRPFMSFGDITLKDMKKKLAAFLGKGEATHGP